MERALNIQRGILMASQAAHATVSDPAERAAIDKLLGELELAVSREMAEMGDAAITPAEKKRDWKKILIGDREDFERGLLGHAGYERKKQLEATEPNRSALEKFLDGISVGLGS